MSKESGDYAKKSAEFKRWLALYFIDKGNWKLTDKAIEEFGQDAIPKQTMEFAEVCSDREREERAQYRVGLTAKEKKRIAHMKVADMLEQGKAEELYDRGYVTNGRLSWKDKSVRVTVVRKLVEVLDKDPRDLTYDDFSSNRLNALFDYYNSSPYKAVKEVFPEMDIKPWEMTKTPDGIFHIKENRVAAVKWLVVEKLKKDPRDLKKKDFENNRLGGLLIFHYKNSPYSAVKEAFSEIDIKPWEMTTTPHGFYDEKENRVAAVKRLVNKIDKDPRDITAKDFEENGLVGLLSNYYDSSPYGAVKEAFPEMDIKPWEMTVTPRKIFDEKENRIAAVKQLVEKVGKDPRNIRREDFFENRLTGLLNHRYGGSPYVAITEAFPELNVEPWEMATTPMGFYKEKENRIAAVKWLVQKLKKDPRDLKEEDFNSNRLGGLLTGYYNGSPYKVVKEAGLVSDADEPYMRRYGQVRFQDVPSSKQARDAAKKLERNAGKTSKKASGKARRQKNSL